MLYIFMLDSKLPSEKGQAFTFMVAAPTQAAARALASTRAGCEGWRFWLDPELTTCEAIGDALPEEKPRIILRGMKRKETEE